VTEVPLLGVVGSEAVLYDVGAGAMATGDCFGNHANIIAQLIYHSSLVHYQQGKVRDGRVHEAVDGEPAARKSSTAGSERGVRKHAAGDNGRCALLLLYEGGWCSNALSLPDKSSTL
jgi:hypothetical protein